MAVCGPMKDLLKKARENLLIIWGGFLASTFLAATISPYSNFQGFILNLCFMLVVVICLLVGMLIPSLLFCWSWLKYKKSLDEEPPQWVMIFSGVISLLSTCALVHFIDPVILKIPAPILSFHGGPPIEPDYP